MLDRSLSELIDVLSEIFGRSLGTGTGSLKLVMALFATVSTLSTGTAWYFQMSLDAGQGSSPQLPPLVYIIPVTLAFLLFLNSLLQSMSNRKGAIALLLPTSFLVILFNLFFNFHAYYNLSQSGEYELQFSDELESDTQILQLIVQNAVKKKFDLDQINSDLMRAKKDMEFEENLSTKSGRGPKFREAEQRYKVALGNLDAAQKSYDAEIKSLGSYFIPPTTGRSKLFNVQERQAYDNKLANNIRSLLRVSRDRNLITSDVVDSPEWKRYFDVRVNARALSNSLYVLEKAASNLGSSGGLDRQSRSVVFILLFCFAFDFAPLLIVFILRQQTATGSEEEGSDNSILRVTSDEKSKDDGKWGPLRIHVNEYAGEKNDLSSS